MSGLRRVIVGASGSPGNLCALRYAEHLARATGATLIPVHAWIPPGGGVADRRSPSLYLRRVWTEDARQRLAEALEAAWGQPPADLDIKPRVERGEPGAALTSIANQTGDVLVIGTGRRGTLTHLVSGRVSRYCLAHAHVPLVAIPPPTLASHLRHGPLRWMFWHQPLTPDGVLHDRGKTAALTPPGRHPDRRGLVPACDGRWQTRDRGDHGPGAEGLAAPGFTLEYTTLAWNVAGPARCGVRLQPSARQEPPASGEGPWSAGHEAEKPAHNMDMRDASGHPHENQAPWRQQVQLSRGHWPMALR